MLRLRYGPIASQLSKVCLDDFYGNIKQQEELADILGASSRGFDGLKNAQLSPLGVGAWRKAWREFSN